jgi:hypothetical protein
MSNPKKRDKQQASREISSESKLLGSPSTPQKQVLKKGKFIKG